MAVVPVPIEQLDTQLLISHDPDSGWLAISGEIDAWNVEAIRDALAEAHRGGGDLHLDLRRLLFCDVTGIRAVVAAAGDLEGGRRLLLHGLDPQLQKVFRVVGWDGMPSLVIDADRMHLS